MSEWDRTTQAISELYLKTELFTHSPRVVEDLKLVVAVDDFSRSKGKSACSLLHNRFEERLERGHKHYRADSQACTCLEGRKDKDCYSISDHIHDGAVYTYQRSSP